MSIRNMDRDELELLSYKDITYLLLEDDEKQTTPELFRKIVELLELPSSVYESKIGDFYMMLMTDKRFILLDDGKWDLRDRHTSDIINNIDVYDDSEEEDTGNKNKEDSDLYEDDIDMQEYDDDDSNDDYKDLVIVDEDELDLEE
ncbi:MAG: DNA-directed RNA polymerase subunit delta [bacterium]|nr:DNA-directed RNA polymerase subunit delta [bacterium]